MTTDDFWRKVRNEQIKQGTGVSYDPDYKKRSEEEPAQTFGSHHLDLEYIIIVDKKGNEHIAKDIIKQTGYDYQGRPSNPHTILKYKAWYKGNLFIFKSSDLSFKDGIYYLINPKVWYSTGYEGIYEYCFKTCKDVIPMSYKDFCNGVEVVYKDNIV